MRDVPAAAMRAWVMDMKARNMVRRMKETDIK
jgi:hypothetical protein